MCRESNCDQRSLCQKHYRIPARQDIVAAFDKVGIEPERIAMGNGMIQVEGDVDTQNLVHLRNCLRYPVISSAIDYAGGHNWANVTDEVAITEVDWQPAHSR